METKDRIEILAIVERLLGMISIFRDVIAAECHHRDDDGLNSFGEYFFDKMYGEIEDLEKIAAKPFPKYRGHEEL